MGSIIDLISLKHQSILVWNSSYLVSFHVTYFRVQRVSFNRSLHASFRTYVSSSPSSVHTLFNTLNEKLPPRQLQLRCSSVVPLSTFHIELSSNQLIRVYLIYYISAILALFEDNKGGFRNMCSLIDNITIWTDTIWTKFSPVAYFGPNLAL